MSFIGDPGVLSLNDASLRTTRDATGRVFDLKSEDARRRGGAPAGSAHAEPEPRSRLASFDPDDARLAAAAEHGPGQELSRYISAPDVSESDVSGFPSNLSRATSLRKDSDDLGSSMRSTSSPRRSVNAGERLRRSFSNTLEEDADVAARDTDRSAAALRRRVQASDAHARARTSLDVCDA